MNIDLTAEERQQWIETLTEFGLTKPEARAWVAWRETQSKEAAAQSVAMTPMTFKTHFRVADDKLAQAKYLHLLSFAPPQRLVDPSDELRTWLRYAVDTGIEKNKGIA